MLGGTRSSIPGDLLTEALVTRYWDGKNTLGTWLARQGIGHQPIVWDAYLLFDANAHWSDVTKPKVFGTTIIGTSDRPSTALRPYLTPARQDPTNSRKYPPKTP